MINLKQILILIVSLIVMEKGTFFIFLKTILKLRVISLTKKNYIKDKMFSKWNVSKITNIVR